MIAPRPGVAALPMYDWPEVRAETDRLWVAIARELASRGVAAPSALERERPLDAIWTDPGLVLAQTCGLPLVTRLTGKVQVVGTPAYALEGASPGDYHSVVVVGPHSRARDVADLRGARVAFNGRDSQSGHAALASLVAPLAEGGRFFGFAIESGAHRRSIWMVADGAADFAAIDAVSFALALDHDPAARAVRVLTTTPPTPGLPMVTASRRSDAEVALLADAVEAAIASLDERARAALHLTGFARTREVDYAVIAERIAEARALGYPALA